MNGIERYYWNWSFVLLGQPMLGAYLVLNLLFLALEGVTNPNQGAELRVMLFLLVFLTGVLSTLLAIRHSRNLEKERKPI